MTNDTSRDLMKGFATEFEYFCLTILIIGPKNTFRGFLMVFSMMTRWSRLVVIWKVTSKQGSQNHHMDTNAVF